jgi:hypothetical protein
VGFAFLQAAFCLPALYFVSPSGSDSYPGSTNQPWRTLQHAADQVQAGDIVLIRSGTYDGFRSKSSGMAGLFIQFRAEDGANVVVNEEGPDNWHGSIINIENHDWWLIVGLEVTGATGAAGIDVREASFVVIRDCYCHHNQKWGIFTGFVEQFTAEYNECSYSVEEHGIYHSNSGDGAVIRHNYCHHNYGCGIQINADPSMGGDGICSDARVEYNIVYANGAGGGAGINLASVQTSRVANNLVYGNLAGGIAMWDDGPGTQWGSKNNWIVHNTVHMPSASRWALNMINGSTGNQVYNNILIHNGSRGGLETDTSSASGLASDYNIMARVSLNDTTLTLAAWQTASGQDAHSSSRSAAETFVSPGSDYHLLETAWAVDHGLTLAEYTDDLDGQVRPLGRGSDIGCYELEPDELIGDINQDGVLDNDDYLLLARYLVGNRRSNYLTLDVADLNMDGIINVVDLAILKGLL